MHLILHEPPTNERSFSILFPSHSQYVPDTAEVKIIKQNSVERF